MGFLVYPETVILLAVDRIDSQAGVHHAALIRICCVLMPMPKQILQTAILEFVQEH